jgi:hypothetical protein
MQVLEGAHLSIKACADDSVLAQESDAAQRLLLEVEELLPGGFQRLWRPRRSRLQACEEVQRWPMAAHCQLSSCVAERCSYVYM